MTLLLLASNNNGKLIEMQHILADLPFELTTPRQIGLVLEVDEDGGTYAENAAKKALAFQKVSGLITLADDSGLEVDALGGKPGIHSHRFSPKPNATDADRRSYLIECLQDKPRPWKAHFHCEIAIATPSGLLEFAQGDCPGEIIPTERGNNGFGYDPIFFMPEYQATLAELSPEVKNTLSHRARAIQAARPILEKLLVSGKTA